MLGSALVTLALATSPAWAATPDPATDDSTGARQAGPVKANAPVRVLSDGDNEAGAQGGSTGEQSATDSEGAAQVKKRSKSSTVVVARINSLLLPWEVSPRTCDIARAVSRGGSEAGRLIRM